MADRREFEFLLQSLADSWAELDNIAAARCFTVDAVYMEPPDVQLFVGRDELTAYFSPLTEGTYLDFHGIWFDEPTQTGAAEFSFGVRGAETADHGVVVVGLDGRAYCVLEGVPEKRPGHLLELHGHTRQEMAMEFRQLPVSWEIVDIGFV